jgi:hypothetical protein
MSVYIDKLRRYAGNGRMSGQWCHMVADSLEELHAMAEQIGLQRSWFQERSSFPHYDLRPSKRTAAIMHGAIEVSDRELIGLRHVDKTSGTLRK